ncbi:MAG: DUF2800 domain-containing protein [Paraprevotella sp.]|nr:DUF2800 domain-containing protein [Paraprevotella sp.]
MAEHALFSPSGAHQWAVCPGSLVLSRGLGNESNAAADEGTMLHAVMQDMLERGRTMEDFPNLSDEQRMVCRMCAEHVRAIPRDFVVYEVKFNFGTMMMQKHEECFGTADVVLVKNDTCRVVDYKFGYNYVDPQKNYQGILYIIGVMESLDMMGIWADNYEFEILQPRVGSGVSNGVWRVSRDELKDWIVTMRRACSAVKKADEADANCKTKEQRVSWCSTYLKTDKKACEFCKAAHLCPALEKKVKDETLAFFESVETDMDEQFRRGLTSADLARKLNDLSLIKLYVKTIEDEAMSRALNGNPPDGYKLIKGREGIRKWSDAAGIVEALEKRGYAMDEFYTEPELISPAKLQTKLASIDMSKQDAKLFVDAFTERKEGKPALVDESAPGELWERTSANDFDVL